MNGETKPLRCIDGWHTDDPDEYRHYTRECRSWTYGAQVARDVRSWKTWGWWLMGLAGLAVGIARGTTRGGAVFCAVVFGQYLYMLHTVVSGYRNVRLLDGVVREFGGRHPLHPSYCTGRLTDHGGKVRERVTAMLPEWAVKAHANPDGSMRVLVAHAPTAQYSPVIGIRLADQPPHATDRADGGVEAADLLHRDPDAGRGDPP